MRQQCHILIVDDDPDDLHLMKRAFEKAGDVNGQPTFIETAKNGLEAISILGVMDTLDDLPDVVMLDLNMPIMDGMDFLKALPAALHNVSYKTIVVTTSVERQIHENALGAGANAIFVKPDSQAEVFKLAADVLHNFDV